jgi:UDP-2-acetamido-3-amino-2,3-dideoxy-glucuronate N-acetyltransferase
MIHSNSEVHTSNIGEGTKIWQYVIILKDAIIGENCNVNCHTFIENDVIIGNNVTIKAGVYLWDGIRIEDDVFLGPNATFVNNNYVRSKQYPDKHIGATIQKGASVGANATIMGNLTIGKYAFIGAGSVVTKNIPPYQVWYGNPAIHKGYITQEGEMIGLNLKSKSSNRKFNYKNEELMEIKPLF